MSRGSMPLPRSLKDPSPVAPLPEPLTSPLAPPPTQSIAPSYQQRPQGFKVRLGVIHLHWRYTHLVWMVLGVGLIAGLRGGLIQDLLRLPSRSVEPAVTPPMPGLSPAQSVDGLASPPANSRRSPPLASPTRPLFSLQGQLPPLPLLSHQPPHRGPSAPLQTKASSAASPGPSLSKQPGTLPSAQPSRRAADLGGAIALAHPSSGLIRPPQEFDLGRELPLDYRLTLQAMLPQEQQALTAFMQAAQQGSQRDLPQPESLRRLSIPLGCGDRRPVFVVALLNRQGQLIEGPQLLYNHGNHALNQAALNFVQRYPFEPAQFPRISLYWAEAVVDPAACPPTG
jgi:hypothetical protein